jgi:polysaccharide biosynthesis/export protein
MRPKFYPAYLLLLMSIISSCSISHNRMFSTKSDYVVDSIRNDVSNDRNYVIQTNDYISIKVYTNGGEKIIDPTSELQKNQGNAAIVPHQYLVRTNGFVKCPMAGDIFLRGLTLYQADSLLEVEYSRFYQDVFVHTKLLNKRVTVIGPLGGRVVPLENENLNLIEVIALYGGIPETGKSYNIKIIRGHNTNPDVQIIDLSTIEGMKKANLEMRPNDIVYIEPVKRIFIDSVRDISPLVGVLTGLFTIWFIYNQQR